MSTTKVTTTGFEGLIDKLFEIEGNAGSRAVASKALKAAAEPVKAQMIANIEAGDHVRTGILKDAIAIDGMHGIRKRGYRVKVGVIGNSAPHAHLVEYGHGGPKPAPEYPFMDPALQATKDQATQIMADILREALGLE